MVGRVPLPPDPRDPRSRAGLAAIRQSEPLGRTGGPPSLPHADGPDLCQARGDLRHRRYRLPQAGEALRRRPASILRPTGQAGQLPGRRHAPLRQPRGAFPAGAAALPPEVLDRIPRSGSRRPASRGIPRTADQGGDRPGAARPGPWRGAARSAGRRGLRVRVSQPFREGLEQRGLSYIVGVAGDGRLHGGARVGAPGPATGRRGPGGGRGGGPAWRRASRDR